MDEQVEMFPAMPLAAWSDTKDTLHRFLQVVGKIRLATGPRRNHWWHVAFHLTGRGVTTRPTGGRAGVPVFTVDFDFVDHRVAAHTLTGRSVSFPLPGQSVASFHRELTDALRHLGVEVSIRAEPFDLPDLTPFAQDTGHAAYDPRWVTRYWRVLSQVGLVLEEFSGRFAGKVSPVHHFWHTFDLAASRYSDRRVDQPADVDPVTREAYSREVVSAGFWFGDQAFPEPAFYSYTAPEPPGLADAPLAPEAARWVPQRGSHLAVLTYDDARRAADPRAAALKFYESAYQAGATRAGWDVAALAAPGGVTDPRLGA
jgi:hypothetical protein